MERLEEEVRKEESDGARRVMEGKRKERRVSAERKEEK